MRNLNHPCEFPKKLSLTYVGVFKLYVHRLNKILFTFKQICSFKSFEPEIVKSEVTIKTYCGIDFLIIFTNYFVNFRG